MGYNTMVTVPYEDFLEGVSALADLNAIRALVESGDYCSTSIKAVLGMWRNKDDDAND